MQRAPRCRRRLARACLRYDANRATPPSHIIGPRLCLGMHCPAIDKLRGAGSRVLRGPIGGAYFMLPGPPRQLPKPRSIAMTPRFDDTALTGASSLRNGSAVPYEVRSPDALRIFACSLDHRCLADHIRIRVKTSAAEAAIYRHSPIHGTSHSVTIGSRNDSSKIGAAPLGQPLQFAFSGKTAKNRFLTAWLPNHRFQLLSMMHAFQ